MRLEKVVMVVDHGCSPFEFAIACEVFGVDRTAEGLPRFEFAMCSPSPGPVRTALGFTLDGLAGLDVLAGADLVIVAPCGEGYCPTGALTDALRRAVARGAVVASLCTGAFTLAHAGLLEGRRATTHWYHSARFRAEFPEVHVMPDVLYVVDGPVATSAGTAAGIDLCLHLVRQAHGTAAANGIARRMVVPPHREGGQSQYVEAPLGRCEADTLAPVLAWATEHLEQDLSVAALARRAAMSERTFARRFREETGTTPHHWVLAQRVALAEQLLEQEAPAVEEIARRCGFGSATMLRHHFTRLRGTTPTAYRRAFGHRSSA